MIYTILLIILLITVILLAISIGYIAIYPEGKISCAIARFLLSATVIECGLLIWTFLIFGV